MTRRGKRYGSGAWRRLTLEVQRRDHWTCQLCGAPSWCVDHVIRPDEGGPFFDPSNLQAACRACNTARRYHGASWAPPNRRVPVPNGTPVLVVRRSTPVTDYSVGRPKPRIG